MHIFTDYFGWFPLHICVIANHLQYQLVLCGISQSVQIKRVLLLERVHTTYKQGKVVIVVNSRPQAISR